MSNLFWVGPIFHLRPQKQYNKHKKHIYLCFKGSALHNGFVFEAVS